MPADWTTRPLPRCSPAAAARRLGVALALPWVAASRLALAEPQPFPIWEGSEHPPPPPAAAPERRDPGAEPREWARSSGEVTARSEVTSSLLTTEPLPRLRPPRSGLALVGLRRVSPHLGFGLAAIVGAPASGTPGAFVLRERADVVLRAAAREQGAFDPYAELGAGVARVEDDTAPSVPALWGAHGRIGGGAAWYVARSLRLGTILALETVRFRTLGSAGAATGTPARDRWLGAVTGGLELSICFGAPH